MKKPLKSTPEGQAHGRLVSDQRRAKTAKRVVTSMLTHMVEGHVPAETGSPEAEVLSRAAGAARSLVQPAPLGHTANATDELQQGGQFFGDVLRAIGQAVVISQAALDDAAIESAKQLSETKLAVAVTIRQGLDDDGNIILDDPLEPFVDLRPLSLSSFILPTLHQWQHVAVSMDLTVGEIDATAGIKVKSGGVSAGVSAGAGGFSAAGEFNYSSLNAESRLRADFSNGAVRFDALLGPREEFRYPEVADFAIGPQILVTQEAVLEADTRKVTLTITLLTTAGAVSIIKRSIDLRLPPDLTSRLRNTVSGSLDITGSTTRSLVLHPDYANDPPQSFRIQLKFGDLVKLVDVVL